MFCSAHVGDVLCVEPVESAPYSERRCATLAASLRAWHVAQEVAALLQPRRPVKIAKARLERVRNQAHVSACARIYGCSYTPSPA